MELVIATLRTRAVLAATALALAACHGSPEVGPVIAPEIQRLPFNGLSAVESPPDTAEQIELWPNPALIDGNTTASTGVNVGFGLSETGDRDARHVAARLADAVTPVRLLRVFVDRALPPEISSAFAWTAYRSDDNSGWTPVALEGPVTFDPERWHFELRIPRTQARYLKVVTRPLPVGVSADEAYREIFVTELQLFDLATW